MKLFLYLCLAGSALARNLHAASLNSQIDALKAGRYGPCQEIVFTERSNYHDGHWYANFGYWISSTNQLCYGRFGRLCALHLQTGKVRTLLEDPEGTIRDPCVHYDAKKILFSYRKGGTRLFHLYEINCDGTGLVQLTHSDFDELEPCYLPDGGIVFCSSHARRWVNCWFTQVATIYRCDGDGSNIRQLSSNIEQDNTPWVLADGRIVYMRWEYVDRSRVNYHHLWTMNPDGTAQNIFFGNLHPGGVYLDAKPIPGSDDVVFIESPGHGRLEHQGYLSRVSCKAGPDEKRNLIRLADDVTFRDPWAFSDDLFMVASGRELLFVTANKEKSVCYTVTHSNEAVWVHEPRPLMPHPREPVLSDRTEPAAKEGVFVLENIYEGRKMANVKLGTIKRLMILETLPKPVNFSGTMEPTSYNGTFTLSRILGWVPVEADGSAHFTAPAVRSLFFIALDKQDRAVKRMQSFTQVMPGETLGCLGCHESRTLAPRKPPTGYSLAARRHPSTINPDGRKFDVPDFPRHIQPILDRHCVRCHNSNDLKGNVNLSAERSMYFTFGYLSLAFHGVIKDGRDAARSNYDPYTLGSGDPTFLKKGDGSHHEVYFSADEQTTIKQWLDASAPYAGTYAALGTSMVDVYPRKSITDVLERRCDCCHATRHDEKRIERGWKFDDPFARNMLFNFTRPEKSRFLLAPLSKSAGGFGLCTNMVFASTSDPDYVKLITEIKAGSDELLKRANSYEVPGFRPRAEYIREMIRFGVLPRESDSEKTTIDVFATDRKYWDLFVR